MNSLIVDFAMDTMTAMPAPPAQFNNSVVGTTSASFGQGNLLEGIDKKKTLQSGDLEWYDYTSLGGYVIPFQFMTSAHCKFVL